MPLENYLLSNPMFFSTNIIDSLFDIKIIYMDIIVKIYNNDKNKFHDYIKLTTAYSKCNIPLNLQEFFIVFPDIKNIILYYSKNCQINIFIGIKKYINSDIILKNEISFYFTKDFEIKFLNNNLDN